MFIIGRVLVINVQPIQSIVFQQLDRGFDKPGPEGWGHNYVKHRRIRPASDREKNLKMAVLFLKQIELLEVSIEVVADIVPGVTGVVNVFVGPWIRQDDLASVGGDRCKSVQNMPGEVKTTEMQTTREELT
jgi:hypothetical protein